MNAAENLPVVKPDWWCVAIDETDQAEDGELKTSEAALVREVASDLLTEMERRLARAKAKIKPKRPDGHKFVSQGKCSCGFEAGDEPNGPCPFKT